MTKRPGPDDELVDLFVTASRALVGVAIRAIEVSEAPVTVAQHRVLVLLSDEGGLTVGALAALLGINQSGASRLVDRLHRLGLVERRRSPSDGRAVEVQLTSRGAEVVASVARARGEEIREVLQELPVEDAQALVSALVAFNEASRERDRRRSNAHAW